MVVVVIKLVRRLGLVYFITFFLLIAGCSLMRKGSPREEVIILLVLDKPVYRPNEPVLATLRVQNLIEHPLKIYKLDAHAVTFYKINVSIGEPMEVMPVFSEKEPLLTVEEVKPHGGMERTFVFTTITKENGEYALQAFFDRSPLGGTKGHPTVISEPKYFHVSGTAPYERDGKGVLKKKDAIEIIKRRLGQPVKEAFATLVKNEAGFYDWWVTLTIEGESDEKGQPLQKAYFINPYLAAVRKEAKPYTAPQKEEKPPVPLKKLKLEKRPKPRPIVPQIKKKGEKSAP